MWNAPNIVGYNPGMVGPHYVTKLLLKQFAGDSRELFERIKESGGIEQRAHDKAGAEIGIWPDEIETGPMQQWDTEGHRVLRERVFRSDPIVLTTQERTILNQWLFIYLIRSPANRERCKNMHRSGLIRHTHNQNMDQNQRELLIDRERYLHDVRASNPELYAERAKKYGQKELDNALIEHWRTNILMHELKGSKDGKELYHHMLTSGNYRRYVKLVSGMKWTWLRSDSDFIIGDNPYCACDSRTGSIGCGLGSPTLEIFFPLTRHLCLWMHRRRRRVERLKIDEAQVSDLNRRQLHSAIAKAWGPSKEVLSITGAMWNRSPIP